MLQMNQHLSFSDDSLPPIMVSWTLPLPGIRKMLFPGGIRAVTSRIGRRLRHHYLADGVSDGKCVPAGGRRSVACDIE